MTALILLPIAVVLALAALLYLFFRRLPEVEARARVSSGVSSTTLFSIGDRVKRISLSLIERLARFFKFLFLRVHNDLSALASRAREGRLRIAERLSERKKYRVEKQVVSADPLPPEHISFEGKELLSEETPERVTETMTMEDASSQNMSEDVSSKNTHTSRDSSLRRWFRKEDAPLISGSPELPLSAPLSSSEERESSETKVKVTLPEFGEAAPKKGMYTRAADIGRKMGGAVGKLRSTRYRGVVGTDVVIKQPRKEQLEDILVERISMNPRDIEAYERLGDYYLEQGNLSDAKECYRQVLKLSPAYRLVKIKIRRLERLLEKERSA